MRVKEVAQDHLLGKDDGPFGADESMGITSTTTSPGFTKSAMTRLAGFAWPAAAATDSLSSRTFVPVAALTAIFRTMAPREA